MIYSVSYLNKYKQEAEEVRCPYNQLGLLWQFIKDNKDKRYNIIVGNISRDEIDKIIEQVNIIHNAGCEYTVECGNPMLLQTMLDKGYCAYLSLPVTDWELFDTLINLGVSDIYIDGPLGFDCGRAFESASKRNIKIRVSPSVSPNSMLAAGPNENSFFIRPEDLRVYEPYIDVIDFKTFIIDREETLFSIYKRGSYLYDLKDLISNLNISVSNPLVSKEFATYRLDCRQRCKIPGYHCYLCKNEILAANYIEKLGSQMREEENKSDT